MCHDLSRHGQSLPGLACIHENRSTTSSCDKKIFAYLLPNSLDFANLVFRPHEVPFASAVITITLPPISPEFIVSILASALALGSADYSWRHEAICRDTDPELFFPVGTTGQALLQIDRAKQVCAECNVRISCLEFALETNQDSGIWGGTSEEERRNIRRQIAARNRAAAQLRASSAVS